MDCSEPGSSVHEILQARILGVGCHALLHGIFLIFLYGDWLEPQSPYRRQILYRLSHQESQNVGLTRNVVVGINEVIGLVDPPHSPKEDEVACHKDPSVPHKCAVLRCFSNVRLFYLPGFSICGILQMRILEWAAMPSSRGFS